MGWVSLFSGGKDSSWALYQALQSDRDVTHLLTVHPAEDSYMYHTPATDLTALAAEAIGRPVIDVDATALAPDEETDASAHGDREIEPLEQALRDLASEQNISGLIAGAVESEFQTTRVEALADRLGVATYTPLWQADPASVLEEMIEAGFEIRIVQVAAAGFDASWLGRKLDATAVRDLKSLRAEYGVHLLGEGGEFETLVTDGPHMDSRISITGRPVWNGTRGHLEITEATLLAD